MTATTELLGQMRSHGLLILAPLAVLEGPVVSIVAGYLASRGVLLLRAVIPVVILADLLGDVALYALGRWGRRFLPPRPALARMARRLRDDGTRILVLGKLTHTAGFAVLIAAGVARFPLGRFVLVNLVATIPKSLVFLALGWTFGAAWADGGGAWGTVIAATTLACFLLFLWQPWRRR
ncbi:MAG: VTT domain-containing protein [Rhodobacter sp.]|nr:VTT domain-containing protein [Paracoccaceae bacterium]MCC0081502.1 VTT domain-containing protein [Rhodobacter sp.]